MAPRFSRRLFLKAGLAAGSSLLVSCTLAARPQSGELPLAPPTNEHPPPGAFGPSVWLRVDPDEQVTITIAKSEMGQGVHTALAMLLADELDADWAQVRVVQAPADGRYGNQYTVGSTSVEETHTLLRSAGAAARMMLVAATAQVFGVDAPSLRVERGTVSDPASGRRLSYGQLAPTAATLDPPAPEAVQLKPREALRLVGTPVPRVDAPAKVDGSARFGIDIQLPGMRYAVLARPTSFGARLTGYDEAAALAVPGVRLVLPLDAGVAVVGDTTWAAIKGRAALAPTWEPGPHASLDSATIEAQLEAGLAGPLARVAGDAPAGTVRRIEATYRLPFRAHSAIEPTSYTADVGAGSATIWAPAQDPQAARLLIAEALGMAPESVGFNVTFLGGAFGRRLKHDGAVEAALISRAAGAPVKLVYTRDDELRHSFYHPASLHHLSAELDSAGLPLSWRHALAAGFTAGDFQIGDRPPYRIPIRLTAGALVESPVPQGWWRGVDFVQMVFATECFIDEIAAASGRDPLELRRALCDDDRLLAVLNLAAERAGWGEPLPSRMGRGVALCLYNQTRVAQVVQVRVDATGTPHVERVTVAVDCGLPINPLGITAQVEGSIAFALTTALKGGVTVAKGRIAEANFDGAQLLRHGEMPPVEVHLIEGGPAPSGMGEPAVPPLAPALLNAIFAATGRRLRSLPIIPAELAKRA
ncbi:MAG: xanthine dehydrogenase family protein molybdopterin-binding subunit [Chloroflexi bacterium OHK40]